MLKKDAWEGYIRPGRIFGNLYFVGTVPSSVHLIDTGDGLMLIDTGYLSNLYLVINNIWELGFDVKDIKYILLSHGHMDHVNGAAALAALTGAKTFLGRRDAWLVTGEVDHFSVPVRPFTPDVLLDDGDVIELGNTRVECISTPGHTDGTMSFFFDVTDGKETLRAGMFGGAGINTLKREFLIKHGLPFENREKYFDSLSRIENERVDVFIGNHVGNNDTAGKLEKSRNSEENPFVDGEAWGEFIRACRARLENLIKEESDNDEK